MDYDVVVVGAGPGGSWAANVCAKKGLKVALLEKNVQPGLKLCAGGLQKRVFHEFGLENSIVECHPKSFCYCFPDKNQWTKNEESLTVNRRIFDRYLADIAVKSGAKLFLSHRCVGVQKKDGKVSGIIVKTPEGIEEIMAKVVISADGFYSSVARSVGLQPSYGPSDVGLAVQCEVYVTKSKVDEETVYLFYGEDISPCGYGWIYPKKHGYTVGVGCLLSRVPGKLTQNLEYLLSKHPIASKIISKGEKRSTVQAACIPLKPSPQICGEGILIVGDAAGQVSPLSADGIYSSMKAGNLAGLVVSKAITTGDISKERLSEYQKIWEEQYGHQFKHQKKILESIENHYVDYVKTRISAGNKSFLRKLYVRGLGYLSRPRLR